MWLAFILVLFAALPSAPGGTPTVNDSVRLDSIRQLVQFYEEQGDYEQAYGQGLVYTDTRIRMQLEAREKMVEEYEKEFANEALEKEQQKLKQQQAQIALDQIERDLETTRLRRQQDSIDIANQQLLHQNRQTIHHITGNHLKQQEEAQQQLNEQKRTRVLVATGLTVGMLILLGLVIAYTRSYFRATRRVEAEKKRAESIMEKAQDDNETQNRFLLNLTDQLQEPTDHIVRYAQEVSDMSRTAEARKEASENLLNEISGMLTQVNDLIAKCSQKTGERMMTVLALASCLTMGSPTPARAQDNPYGIRNDLYEYYKQADAHIQSERLPAMADTLLQRAKTAGDKLAQCMALDLKVGHAYFSFDVNQVKAALEPLKECALATGNDNYVFYGWNRAILVELAHKDFVNAMQETRLYQEEAMRMNNTYGISRGYYYMGDIFNAWGMLNEATEQYEMTIAYLNEHESPMRLSSVYARLGETYAELGNDAKAEQCLLESVKKARFEYEKVAPNLGLLELYVTRGKTDKATAVIPEVERLKAEGLLIDKRYIAYMNSLVKYYLLKGENEKAMRYLDSIGDSHPRTKYMAYAAIGDYERAVDQIYAFNRAAKADDASLDAARLAALKAEFDNNMKERANRELELNNTRLRTEQLKAERELSYEQHQRDSLLLTNSYLQQDAQEAQDALQQTEENARYERMKHEATQMGYRRILLDTLLALTAAVILFLGLRLWNRRRSAEKWQQQKEEAEKATALAREAEQNKKNFLEQITHEMRTPLNAVLGFSEVVSDENMCEACSEEELADFRLRILDGADQFNRLVKSSLQLCAIEGGRRKAMKQSFGLNALLQQLGDEYRPKLKKGVELRTPACPNSLFLNTDKDLLRQALCLLLDNAMKFTEQGHIEVRYEGQKQQARILVEDTGCGIPAEKAEVIFRHFEKVDSFVPGIGLGLCLCRSIVTLLGGEVSLDTAYTGGSRFVIEL
jgi:signal transduction histidine kinase